MAHNQKKSERMSNWPKSIFVLAIVAILLVSGGTLARYVLQRNSDLAVATAAGFYFESNYLKVDGPSYTIYTDEVTVTITNTDGINVASQDIIYTVSADVENHTLVAEESADTETFIISKPTEGKTQIVTLTATATAPYEKSLAATFTFEDPEDSTWYCLTPSDHYATLELYTGSAVGDVTIDYSDYAPDNTNSLVSNWTNASTKNTLTGLSPNTMYTLVFFGETESNTPEQELVAVDGTIEISVTSEEGD